MRERDWDQRNGFLVVTKASTVDFPLDFFSLDNRIGKENPLRKKQLLSLENETMMGRWRISRIERKHMREHARRSRFWIPSQP
jgi:hypothetical protein